MPVRSLTSRVLKWPKPDAVVAAFRRWADQTAQKRSDVLRIGYFGSYARGNWGVGSDLDVVLIVSQTNQPFVERAREWDLLDLPVPVDVLVYTAGEWEKNMRSRAMFRDIIWIYHKESAEK